MDFYITYPFPTPWGNADTRQEITEGVYEVSTPGHGGILVEKDIASTLLSQDAIKRGWSWGRYIAYEEDCGWALFAYEQPALYAAAHKEADPEHDERWCEEFIKDIARECLKSTYPDYLADQQIESK